MRKTHALTGLAATAVLVVLALAPISSAHAALPRHRPWNAATVLVPTHFARPGMGPAHWFGRGRYGWWGNVAARPRMRTTRSLLALDLLKNPSNGEIMPTTNTHLIFWLPSGFHYGDANGDAAYEAAMQTYFKDVGGSQILNTVTQYPRNNGTPADTSTYVDSIVDTTPFPHTGADVAHAVTQGDLNQEVFNDINSQGWPYGLSDMYFVFLPDNLVDCDNSGTNCNTNAYCAYHTRGWKNGSDTPANDFIWADIPVNRGAYTTGGCGNSNVTGDNQADTTLSSVEHEHLEAITDPRGNAWQDSTGGGGENGDKCNRNMGVANASSTTVDNFLGSRFGDFLRIQREWSNAATLGGPASNGCAASYTTTGSHVEAPSPSGGDVTASVTESMIQGNNGDRPPLPRLVPQPVEPGRRVLDHGRRVLCDRRLRAELDQPRRPRPAPERDWQSHRLGDGRTAAGRDGAHVDLHHELRRLDRNGAVSDRPHRDDHRRQRAADAHGAWSAESGLSRLADVRHLRERPGFRRHGLAQRERTAVRPELHRQRRRHGHGLRDDHGRAGPLHRDVRRERPSPPHPRDRHGADHRHEGRDDHDLHRGRRSLRRASP